MARAGVSALTLILTVRFMCSYASDLMCDDIKAILSGYVDSRNQRWYGDPVRYTNRYCDKCHLNQGGADCKDNSCPLLNGPLGTSIDLTPTDTESWICPRQCASMPQIPIKMNLIKEISTWECIGLWINGGCTIHNTRVDTQAAVPYQIPMSNPFKTADASSYYYVESPDPNTYGVMPISLCKTKRYEDNFNARVYDCWQWNHRGGKPQMSHLNTFWISGEATLHTFKGARRMQQTISQCKAINNRDNFYFQSEPCWMQPVGPEQKAKQFSIQPYYTYYRSMQSKSDQTDCRMLVKGDYDSLSERWASLALLPWGEPGEWDIRNHWVNPLTRRDHFYTFKPTFDVMTERFGNFWQLEQKTVARYDYTIPCKDNLNRQQRSTKVYSAQSGCEQKTCIDFITKPCYDNIYRYDEMVCTLILDVFKGGGISFSKFKEKIISLIDHRQPFMNYGLHDGSSYFDMGYDASKVQVTRDGTTLQPNVPHVFADGHTISVSLLRDANRAYSCDACFDVDLHGRFALTDTAMANDIIACRPCLPYEKVQVTTSTRNYQDCRSCAKHQVRNPGDPAECRKCKEIDPLTPMRRTTPLDTVCIACQFFQYFDENTEQGCRFLPTVTDGIAVVSAKAKLSGKDYYIQDGNQREIESKSYRDKVDVSTPWNTELKPQPCRPAFVQPVTVVKQLKFTAWCGHQEMRRHDQAWLRLHGGEVYLPLNSDPARTRISTSAVELCGGSLVQVQGNPTVDLTCAQGTYKFSIIREGFEDPCTQCLGAKFTDKCWPTYVPGLEQYDDEYFLPRNKALTPQPGTCAWCNKVCSEADHFIDPVEYSCWWNGTGRVPGVLGSSATNFSWYKLAPCSKCDNVKLTTDKAELVLACGNRVSYRRWITDTVTGSELDATRSIPSIQICCAEALPPPATLCTDDPANFETFARLNCKQYVDDSPPAFIPYCPRGWYVDEACSRESALWNPDCCVKCKACRGGLFKLDAYYDCPGDEFFDSQDRGCTTKCLTNQYLRNERCIKCEACE